MAIGAQDKEQKTQQLAAGEHLMRSNPQAAKNLAGHYNNIGAGSTKESGRVPDLPDFRKAMPITAGVIDDANKNIKNSTSLARKAGEYVGGSIKTAGAMVADTAAGIGNAAMATARPVMGAARDFSKGVFGDKYGGDIADAAMAVVPGLNAAVLADRIGSGLVPAAQAAAAKPEGGAAVSATPARDMSPEEFDRRLNARFQNNPNKETLIGAGKSAPGSIDGNLARAGKLPNVPLMKADDGIIQRWAAQQAANGTGITVQRQPDGTLAFSGRGTGDGGSSAAMNPAASGNINMQAGTDAYARALAIRQGMNGGNAGAAMPGLPAAQREVVGIESPRDDGREAIMKAAMTPYKNSPNGQLTARQLEIAKGIAEGAQRERMQDAQNAQNAQNYATRNMIDAQRLGLDQQRFGLDAARQGMEMQNLARLNALQQAAVGAKTPEERKAANDTLLALQGKAPGGNDGGLRNEVAKALLSGVSNGTSTWEEVAPILNSIAPGLLQGMAQQPQAGGGAGGGIIVEDENKNRITI